MFSYSIIWKPEANNNHRKKDKSKRTLSLSAKFWVILHVLLWRFQFINLILFCILWKNENGYEL